jgi:hypothetical protein
MERLGSMVNPIDRKALVAAVDPNTGLPINPPPESELDMLVVQQANPDGTVTDGDKYRIVAPAGVLAQDGTTVVFWRLQVRK